VSKTARYIFLALLLILLCLSGYWYFQKIIFYLLLAVFLTLIGKPFQRLFLRIRFGKFGMPGVLAALLTLFTLYAIFASLFALFIPLIAEEARIIAGVDTQHVVNSLQGPISTVENMINQYSSDKISLTLYAQQKLSTLISAGQVTGLVNSLLTFTGDIFVAFFAVSFFTFFFLKDGKLIFETLLLLSPEKREKDIRIIVEDSKQLLVKYFTGICLDVLCVATLVSLGLFFVGVKNALIIGFFAGVMNVIPYVGPLIAGLFGLFVTVSTSMRPDLPPELFALCIKLVMVFVGVNLLDAFIIQPSIFSKRVRAHPLEIFLVVMVAGTLAGIGGMILAVPVYTVLRVIARQFLSRFRIIGRMTKNLN
jgi:predicted PurR-regulated permease PerM